MSTATLIINDEVNVKITGLDLDTRRHLSNKFKYEIPYARHLPAVRLGRWDGKVGFFQLGGSTYINLLPEILPELESRGYHIDLDDRREYQNDFDFDSITENYLSHKKWPKGHPTEDQPIVLRDYQVDIVNKFLQNPQCIQEVGTGAGKTIVTATLSNAIEKYGRSVVIVPNKSLVTQTLVDYENLGLDVGVYFGDKKQFDRTHTICTWQSLNSLIKNTKNQTAPVTIGEFLEGVVCVMVDEVHQAKADALKSMLTGPMSHIPIRWGLTGTIPKEEFESKSLDVSLGQVINRLAASELQERGVLANCHVNIVQLQDTVAYPDYQSELKYLTTDPERLKAISGLVQTIGQGGNTLILVDRISAGTALQELLGDKSVFISGSTKSTERKEHYDEVADVNDKIIIATYGVAAVGINIPRIFNLVLLEPGKSFVRVIQSIGRGIRKAKDKDFVQIWDITSSCKFAKRHLAKRKTFYKEANYPFEQEKLTL